MYTMFFQSASFILPYVAFYAYLLAICQSKAAVTRYVGTPGYSDVYDVTLVISFQSFSTTYQAHQFTDASNTEILAPD
jgi:hypothetical protein